MEKRRLHSKKENDWKQIELFFFFFFRDAIFLLFFNDESAGHRSKLSADTSL